MIGSLAAVNSAVAADGVIEKDPLSADAYCHEKFASVDPGTLPTNEPDLMNSTGGDTVDFYGPCNERNSASMKRAMLPCTTTNQRCLMSGRRAETLLSLIVLFIFQS